MKSSRLSELIRRTVPAPIERDGATSPPRAHDVVAPRIGIPYVPLCGELPDLDPALPSPSRPTGSRPCPRSP
ncbi:hypothetical protein FNH09_40855, partial [Streptomyces adustus]|nr:hypothetical protein [Streptomyces adustus]